MIPGRSGGAAVATLLTVMAVGCSPPGPPPSPPPAASGSAPSTAADLTAPSGFRASLEHAETKRSDDLVDWRTHWVLRWQAVPGAAGYVIRYSTSEGRGGRERRMATTELKLDVAAGTSPAGRLMMDREAQLTMTASQLLVSVAATGSSGDIGPAVGWYRVGEVPSDGVPVANGEPEKHR